MRVPSNIGTGLDSSRSCQSSSSLSHSGLDAHHSAPARSVAVASGDSAVRARKTRSDLERLVQARAARPRRLVRTAAVAFMVGAWLSWSKSQELSVLPFRVGAVTSPLWVPMMSPAFSGEALSRVDAPWVAPGCGPGPGVLCGGCRAPGGVRGDG